MNWLRKLTLFFGSVITCGNVGAAASAEAQIDRIVRSYMYRENVPGVAVVALRADEVILARGWGVASKSGARPMTPDTVQPLYSISKHIAAALALSLVEAGSLDVNQPVGRYLPEWFADEPALHVEHLLRHSSGIADFIGLEGIEQIENGTQPQATMADVLTIAARIPRRFAPGTWHSYSNSNYTALALIAERLGGRPYAELLRERLFATLGPTTLQECALSRAAGESWSVGYTPAGAAWSARRNLVASFAGNGGTCGSARDLALWLRALAAGRILPMARVREMVSTAEVSSGFTPPYGYGLSTVQVAGRAAWSHAAGGEGWGGWAAYLPDDEITVVVLANRGWLWSTDMALPIVRALLKQRAPAPLRRKLLTPAEQKRLTTRCQDGLFEFELRAERRQAIVHVKPFGEPIELWKTSAGVYVSGRRPDTFRLTWHEGSAPTFDWMEHRSYLYDCT